MGKEHASDTGPNKKAGQNGFQGRAGPEPELSPGRSRTQGRVLGQWLVLTTMEGRTTLPRSVE